MKATTFWVAPNTDATNISGFTAIPGGRYTFGDGSIFNGIGNNSGWWSSTGSSAQHAWARNIYAGINFVYKGNFYKNDGYSVRCVKN